MLRDYQHAIVEECRAAFRRGCRSIAIAAPTGSGKTRIMAAIAAAHAAKRPDARPLFVAHRDELLGQAAATMARMGVACEVRSVQQMLATPSTRPDATLVLWDELHHALAPQWSGVWAHYVGVPRVGVSATPMRPDGTALGELCDALVAGPQPRELIEAGHLVPVTVIAPAARQTAPASDPVAAYLAHGGGERAVVFARTVAHSKRLADAFSAAGVPAASVEGRMSADARRDVLARHRAGALRVLCNVQIATEGYDDPGIGVAILARGVSHAGAWVQIVGRVMRPAPGKARAVVLDLCGAVHDHGLPDDDRHYSLAGRPLRVGEELPALRQCATCGGVWRASLFVDATCPRCGAVAPGRPDPAVRRAELAAVTAERLARLSSSAHVDALRAWVGVARARGYKVGWALRRFADRWHRWPSRAERAGAGLA